MKKVKNLAAMVAMVTLILGFRCGCSRQVQVQLTWGYTEELKNNLDPKFPPAYFAMGGDAINPKCDNPYKPECRLDISTNCARGICNVPINITAGKLYHIWFFRNGQVYASPIFAFAYGKSFLLHDITTISQKDYLPKDNPHLWTWPVASIKID